MPCVTAAAGNSTFHPVFVIRTGLRCRKRQWQSGEAQRQAPREIVELKNKKEQYKLTHITQIP
jgi:hypothetical protein